MKVPLDFEYLRDVAKKYGNFYLKTDFERFVEQVNSEQLTELTTAYGLLAGKKDDFRISKWLEDCFKHQKEKDPGEFWFSRQVGQLFRLFEYLAEKGIRPFSSHEVEFHEEYKRPNWDNLPKELSYLIDVAETYGVHDTETDMLAFLDAAQEKDMEVLARTAETIRLNGHAKMLDHWLRGKRLHENEEAWMIHCLFGVLVHAGLNWES